MRAKACMELRENHHCIWHASFLLSFYHPQIVVVKSPQLCTNNTAVETYGVNFKVRLTPLSVTKTLRYGPTISRHILSLSIFSWVHNFYTTNTKSTKFIKLRQANLVPRIPCLPGREFLGKRYVYNYEHALLHGSKQLGLDTWDMPTSFPALLFP